MEQVHVQRFAEETAWKQVAPSLIGVVLLGAVLYWQFGLAGALPAVFLLLGLLGEALFVTLGVLALLSFVVLSGFGTFTERAVPIVLEMARITESPVFVAIPMFTLAGAVMTRGGISERLVRVMKALLGFLPGGLAIATIGACAFFAALSGSSAVTIIAVGGMLAPALEKDYGKPFSLGLLTSCGAIGILAPPSLPLIIYGVVSETDIQQLFVAGMVPALLTIGMLAVYCSIRGFMVKAPRQEFDGAELLAAVKHGAFALGLPILLLGGIYGGIVTATEASILAVLYAVIVEVGIHREVKVSELYGITVDTMMLVGSILIILLMALSVTNWLTIEQVPQAAAKAIQSTVESRFAFLLALNALLLVVGCVMDIFSAIVVMTPLVLPIAVAYGVDPVHLGIIMVVNLELGFATPPFGINLFISSAFFRRPVAEVFKATLPFLGVLLVGLLLITWLEDLALGLVRASGL